MTGVGERRWRLVRAGEDAVPASVRRFFQARRRWRPRLPGGRRAWAAATAALAVLAVLGWLAIGTSLWGVRQVRVTGVESLSAEEVRQAAGIVPETPLLRVHPGEVAERVRALPAVATVEVRRDWPDTVVIEVVEREPVAAVPVDDQYLLVDADGVVIRAVAAPPRELPVLVLPQAGPENPATQAALTVLAALTPELRAELESLTVTDVDWITLSLSSGWTVVWGDATESLDKARVVTALLDREGEIIDVSAPRVVSVR